MVRSKTILATLALIAATQASPIAHPQENIEPDNPTETEDNAKNCGLKAFEPASWAESGAEKYLGDWLDNNGPGKAINIFPHLELTFPFQIVGFKQSATLRWGPTLLQLIVRT